MAALAGMVLRGGTDRGGIERFVAPMTQLTPLKASRPTEAGAGRKKAPRCRFPCYLSEYDCGNKASSGFCGLWPGAADDSVA